MLSKIRVNQVKWNQLIKYVAKFVLVKEFLFYSTCWMRNGNLLKSRVSEIGVKQLGINQGVDVCKHPGTQWQLYYIFPYTHLFPWIAFDFTFLCLCNNDFFFYQNVTQVWQIFPSRHMSLQNSNIYSVISLAAHGKYPHWSIIKNFILEKKVFKKCTPTPWLTWICCTRIG